MMAGDEVRPLGAGCGSAGATMAGEVGGRAAPGGGGTARAPGAPGGGGTLGGAPGGTGTREAGAPCGAGTPGGTRWLTGVRLAGIAFATRATDGAIDGATAGAIDGATAGAMDGAMDGGRTGAMVGATAGAMVGATAGRAWVGGRTCGTGGMPGGLPCWSSGGAIAVSQLRPVTEGPGGWRAACLRCPSWTSECRSRRGPTRG